ncbi:hypothetical protein [Naasia sp. SYSU D00057]|uniref:hypothetical protein n=1 Tax=Naasia sp. SYSU D00057 TaxID=2817380 RepID=UPI001B310FAE|nr:hypothetical protein [Naasia sp. SYSU D00057]
MGKAGRAQNLQRDAKRAQRLLPELTTAIGDMYGTEAECVEATALLCIVAGRLGITARPRAVSLFAYSPSLRAVAITGARGLAEAQERGLAPSDRSVDDYPGERPWAEVGHMVALTSNPLMVLDPAFRQFSAAGLPRISVLGAVRSATPEDGVWRVWIPGSDVEIAYFCADDSTGWQEDFEAVKPQLRGDADTLTEWFRRGGDADGLRQHIIPRTFFPSDDD